MCSNLIEELARDNELVRVEVREPNVRCQSRLAHSLDSGQRRFGVVVATWTVDVQQVDGVEAEPVDARFRRWADSSCFKRVNPELRRDSQIGPVGVGGGDARAHSALVVVDLRGIEVAVATSTGPYDGFVSRYPSYQSVRWKVHAYQVFAGRISSAVRSVSTGSSLEVGPLCDCLSVISPLFDGGRPPVLHCAASLVVVDESNPVKHWQVLLFELCRIVEGDVSVASTVLVPSCSDIADARPHVSGRLVTLAKQCQTARRRQSARLSRLGEGFWSVLCPTCPPRYPNPLITSLPQIPLVAHLCALN